MRQSFSIDAANRQEAVRSQNSMPFVDAQSPGATSMTQPETTATAAYDDDARRPTLHRLTQAAHVLRHHADSPFQPVTNRFDHPLPVPFANVPGQAPASRHSSRSPADMSSDGRSPSNYNNNQGDLLDVERELMDLLTPRGTDTADDVISELSNDVSQMSDGMSEMRDDASQVSNDVSQVSNDVSQVSDDVTNTTATAVAAASTNINTNNNARMQKDMFLDFLLSAASK